MAKSELQRLAEKHGGFRWIPYSELAKLLLVDENLTITCHPAPSPAQICADQEMS